MTKARSPEPVATTFSNVLSATATFEEPKLPHSSFNAVDGECLIVGISCDACACLRICTVQSKCGRIGRASRALVGKRRRVCDRTFKTNSRSESDVRDGYVSCTVDLTSNSGTRSIAEESFQTSLTQLLIKVKRYCSSTTTLVVGDVATVALIKIFSMPANEA